MKKPPDALRTPAIHPVLDRRRAGILLHPTSLPGEAENGTLGAHALRFVDFLAASGFSVWQMLPLGPTHADRSPYQCLSVHAGNPRLISFAQLEAWGWLPRTADLSAASGTTRQMLLAQARQACLAQGGARDLEAFDAVHAFWLDDYALYVALRQEHDHRAWWQWPEPLRDRDPAALADARVRHAEYMALVRFEQFVFFRQWQELRQAAQARGVQLFGDLPIFVAHDSADVWAQREYFNLDASGQPRVVAGVPPDYFSKTGQRWGNPLYDWARLQADGFRWWIERLRTQFGLFDLVRIDHFRGFEAYWQIPAEEATAIHGRWVPAPGKALFRTLHNEFGTLPVVAEDLGMITPAVHRLREQFGLPGMRILQFAFDGGADNPYLPHNHEVNSVVYTGTHDNDTTLAWFDSLPVDQQCVVLDYLGHPGEPMPWPLIRAALASVARLAMLPMQDALQAGSGQRMNLPGSHGGNWLWRFAWEQIPPGLGARLRGLAERYGRLDRERGNG
ncbi:MAG: 4-alpha-glucanotransferase [Candidatus Muproteobacteria bacterium RBG_19FT_COMBO_61_10]|uniref:4-alpha-glucanotransferase n=1 Tax=Candidatus Muproteobacteria bacterium RBG_19FT_COMBO_61_10 TaxID=1817761 RepID=A0A1F6UNE4_9PROT|nr:MAG: 4-alpha-glucanotransferase [Candidatus Muproteobacteria bacterium RBG_19FT_COMBO_61_10]